jgi:hypothetical protein
MLVAQGVHESSDETMIQVSSGRSKLEIHQELATINEKIQKELNERLHWYSTIYEVGKRAGLDAVQHPIKAAFKLILLSGMGYISFMLFKGMAAGIEVDVDSNFGDLFSHNVTERLSAGLNLTNGEQAGQFMLDAAITFFAAYEMMIRPPYEQFMRDTLRQIYAQHLKDLQGLMDKSEKNSWHFVVAKENLDELYLQQQKQLQHYGEK